MHGDGRACGKVILFGEHVVVYDAPAVVLGVARTLRATATPLPGEGPSELRLLSREARAGHDEGHALGIAFGALLEAAGRGERVRVEVAGDLPPGVGLGFSAAAAVAIARAVIPEGVERRARVEDAATAWERVYHGNPSGVDVAAAMHGGCVRFTRAAGVAPLPTRRGLRVAVGLTGIRSSTREMVEGVARLHATKRDLVERSIEGVKAIVDRGVRALADGDVGALGELMDMNQMILAGLMLSTEEIEALCRSAREAGARGAKLTGAGGGGAVVALAGASDDEEAQRRGDAIVAAWNDLGYEGFVADVRGGAEPSPQPRPAEDPS